MTGSGGRALRDAVHGVISFHRTPLLPAADLIASLIGSAQVQRLSRIRQMPFAISQFPSATHTRLAHSIGTAHMALALLERLQAIGWFDEDRCTDLAHTFADDALVGELSAEGVEPVVQALTTHLVAAALLQDVGELPYKQVLELFLSPSHAVFDRVEDQCEVAVSDDKTAFTLATTIDALGSVAPGRLNLKVVAFLISGRKSPSLHVGSTLSALRTLLDGAVDADRLDYVARDCYFTIGMTPSGQVSAQVVASVVDVTEQGIVVDDPTAVSLLLLQRAVLRTEVFVAGPSRLRSTLLAVVLSGVLKASQEGSRQLFGADDFVLPLRAFDELDDRRLEDGIAKMLADTKLDLDDHVEHAAKALRGSLDGYRFFWMRHGTPVAELSERASLPRDVFVDTLLDLEHHALYEPGSVLVKDSPWQSSEDPIALEHTGGHAAQFLGAGAASEPVSGRFLCFVPASRMRWAEKLLAGPEKGLGEIYALAQDRDAEVRLSLPDDTSERADFLDPVIFVSYCDKDVAVVRRILAVLRQRRRRYRALVNPASGMGGRPRENSRLLAQQCGAAILVLSKEYIERSRDRRSNISVEVMELAKRNGEVPVVAVTVDPFAEYGENLERDVSWDSFGFE